MTAACVVAVGTALVAQQPAPASNPAGGPPGGGYLPTMCAASRSFSAQMYS